MYVYVCVWAASAARDDRSSGKPEKVNRFQCGQGKVRENEKVRDKLRKLILSSLDKKWGVGTKNCAAHFARRLLVVYIFKFVVPLLVKSWGGSTFQICLVYQWIFACPTGRVRESCALSEVVWLLLLLLMMMMMQSCRSCHPAVVQCGIVTRCLSLTIQVNVSLMQGRTSSAVSSSTHRYHTTQTKSGAWSVYVKGCALYSKPIAEPQAMSDHTVSTKTWCWMCPILATAKQASTWFTYPGGIEDWVDLGGWLYIEMVYCQNSQSSKW